MGSPMKMPSVSLSSTSPAAGNIKATSADEPPLPAILRKEGTARDAGAAPCGEAPRGSTAYASPPKANVAATADEEPLAAPAPPASPSLCLEEGSLGETPRGECRGDAELLLRALCALRALSGGRRDACCAAHAAGADVKTVLEGGTSARLAAAALSAGSGSRDKRQAYIARQQHTNECSFAHCAQCFQLRSAACKKAAPCIADKRAPALPRRKTARPTAVRFNRACSAECRAMRHCSAARLQAAKT